MQFVENIDVIQKKNVIPTRLQKYSIIEAKSIWK